MWHAPTGSPLSQRSMAAALATAAGVRSPRVAALPGWALRAMGAASPGTRELAETLYQFERPFVMDSKASEMALGLHPTPLMEAAAATVAWWGTRYCDGGCRNQSGRREIRQTGIRLADSRVGGFRLPGGR